MTIKQLHERLRLMESDEKLSITAGEMRALIHYSRAITVSELARKAEEKVMEYKAVGLTGQEVPNFLASHSVLDYIHNHPYHGAAKEYGEWPCDMEILD